MDQCERISGADALDDGLVAWDSDAVTHAYERLREAAASCDAIGAPVLEGWFRGSLSEGADCTPRTTSLASGYREVCEDGLYCQVTGTVMDYAGTCTLPGAEGDPCGLYTDCAEGLYCDHGLEPEGSPGSEGTCVPELPNGESCDLTLACESNHCHAGECSEPTAAETWCSHPRPAG